MAAPHVAGMAALLYSQGITNPAAIEAAIKRFAKDLGAPAFSDEDEAVDEKHAGYRLSGGVEVLGGRVVSMALEGAYTRVPDALGISGMSEVTGERVLGGFEFRLKLIVRTVSSQDDERRRLPNCGNRSRIGARCGTVRWLGGY